MPESKPDIAVVLTSYGWDGRVSGYGSWQNTHCPFHGADRNPSARVNEEEGVFHCFTCGISGDAYSIVMQHESVSFPRAKEIVKEVTGFDLASHNHRDTGAGVVPTRLVASKLPAWAKNKHAGRKLV